MQREETARSREESRLWRILPWIWLGIAWLSGIFLMACFGRTLLDSDMASEMVLASLLNREGGMVSANWYYSNELRVFCQQLLFKLGLWIFPDHWHAARMLAQALLSVLLAAAYLYFAYGAGLRKSAPLAAGVLLCPFGFWQMFWGVFGGYYFVHMIFVLLSMGLLVRVAWPGGSLRRTWLRIAALAIVGFCAGINGIRILMNLYVPLIVAGMAVLAVRVHRAPLGKPPLCVPEVRVLASAGAVFISSVAGYLINITVLAARYHFRSYNGRIWTNLNVDLLLERWSDFLVLFGYQVDGFQRTLSGTVPLFRPIGLLNVASFVLMGALLFSTGFLIRRHAQLKGQHGLILGVFLSCMIVDGIAFSCLNDSQDVNGGYWLPVVPLAVAVVSAAGQNIPLRLAHARKGLAVCALAMVVCCSTATVMRFIKNPPRADRHLVEVSDWLVEQGYTQGITTFWYANVLTELSNGRIEMWTVNSMETLEPHDKLQETDHVLLPSGRIFVLINPYEEVSRLPYYDEAHIVYADEAGYQILAFEDGRALINAAGDAAVPEGGA